MATSFNTQTGGGEYHLQFETTNRDKFLFMQEAARRCVDGPAKTAAGREALIEQLRSTASVSKRKMLDAAADALENSITESTFTAPDSFIFVFTCLPKLATTYFIAAVLSLSADSAQRLEANSCRALSS